MTYQLIKNTIYWIFVSLWIGFIFFYFFNVPVSGDYWFTEWGIHDIYSLKGGYHPGRNFGELVTTIPRLFASWLSFIPEPLYRHKFMVSIVDTVLCVSLAGISSYIVPTHRKIAFPIFLVCFFYSYLTWTVINQIAVIPMLFVAMVPAIIYLRTHSLPIWMIENPYKTLGFWGLFVYMGTALHDPVYFMGCVFFGMIIAYLLVLKLKEKWFDKPIKDKKSYNIVLALSIFYIILSMFSFYKNTIGGSIDDKYTSSVTFDVIEIITRLRLFHVSIELIIYLSILISCYFIIKMVMTKKINGQTYVFIALTTSSVVAWFLITISGSFHVTYIMWSSLIVVVAFICESWEKNPFTQIVLPTLIFGLVVNVLLSLTPKMRVNNTDIKIIRLLQQAEKEGKTELITNSREVPESDYILRTISLSARRMGYITNDIVIKITN